MGKKDFYPRVNSSLKKCGYNYYDGDMSIKGKGSGHRRKPDYVAVKPNLYVIGEIKSADEGPCTAIWRQIQTNDSDNMKRVREEISEKEKAGKLSKQIGGHIIIIDGQLSDYKENIGKSWELPEDIEKRKLCYGYSNTIAQADNIKEALDKCKKKIIQKIDMGDGTVTYIFEDQ